MIWSRSVDISDLQRMCENSAAGNCGLICTAVGDDWLEATIPLDSRNCDAHGHLHFGALSILAETIGSIAASLCIDLSHQICVGQSLQINHPAQFRFGPILARATPITLDRANHLWNIEMSDPARSVMAVATLTMAILENSQPGQTL